MVAGWRGNQRKNTQREEFTTKLMRTHLGTSSLYAMGQEFEDAPERIGVSILFFTACPLSKLTYLPASVSQKRSISHSGYDDTEHLKIKKLSIGLEAWLRGSESFLLLCKPQVYFPAFTLNT